MLLLTVVPCPDKDLAFTNNVYCAFSNTTLLQNTAGVNRVAINQMIYNIIGHESILLGEIALSEVQRQVLHCEKGNQIMVNAWTDTINTTCTLTNITFLVELMAGGCKTLNEEDLIFHIKNTFANQLLSIDQILVANFQGIAIKLTVKQVNSSNIIIIRGELDSFLTTIVLPIASNNKFLILSQNNTTEGKSNGNDLIVRVVHDVISNPTKYNLTYKEASDTTINALKAELNDLKKRNQYLESKLNEEYIQRNDQGVTTTAAAERIIRIE
jgi:hypothetical protein